jgi:hypothetical protein
MRKSCYQFVLGIISCLVTGAGVQASIRFGPVANPANGHTYYLLNMATWTASQAEAQTLGGHLATVNDAAENDWIFNTFAGQLNNQTKDALWLGLNDIGHPRTFTWISGEPVTYTHWGSGEPNNDPNYAPESYTAMITKPFNSVLPKDWNDTNNAGSSGDTFGVVEVVPEPSILGIASCLVIFARPRRRR